MARNGKKMKRSKKIFLSVTAVILVAAIGIGCWYFVGNRNAEPVFVYEFYNIGMTEYWGDTKESYGPVSTDKVQTVYLSDTQTVTEVFVQAGDTVKKGDILLSFDTTLSDLSLERKRLDVERLKLDLENAEEQLWEINTMVPMVIPEPDEESEEDINLGTALTDPYLVGGAATSDGSTQENALICWLQDTTGIDNVLFEALRQKAMELQAKNRPVLPPAETTPSTEATNPPAETNAPSTEDTTSPTEETSSSTEPTAAPTENPTVSTEEPTSPTGETTSPTEETASSTKETVSPTVSTVPVTQETTPAPQPSTPPAAAVPVLPEVNSFYVIFKVTEGNMSLGQTLTWQGVSVVRSSTGIFQFSFFDASGIPDTSIAKPEEESGDEIQIGSGFTATQIAQMRSEQEKAISKLEFDIKMAEAEYKIMQTEVSDGNVYAQFDGEVVSLLTEEEAKMNSQPFIKVSGGGGFYVQGSVSELDKDSLLIGQEVTVNDWNSGMTYTGIIDSIGDYPTDDNGYYGTGNPNVSYYPFTVFIDGEADFMEYSYVNIMYSSGAIAENGIYLENPFLRTENGRSYVLLRGEDGTLEKRFVTTGKSLWGSYTEILSGISETDWLAFPYGKNVEEGAETVEGDMSDLYGY